MSKLSASAISTFLKSPKQYYWRYVARIQPLTQSVATFDHDLIFGKLWAEFTDAFYKESYDEEHNQKRIMDAWLAQSEGWVPDKARDSKTKALETLMSNYYTMFSPQDGCRDPLKSELWLENEMFCAKLDGLGTDNIVHEVKTASRSPSLTEQLWKVGNSIQVKLYCVLAKADGYRIEFAFKDPPHQIVRGPIVYVNNDQRITWSNELHELGEAILKLGDSPDNYPCHPDGCCLITKGMVSMCWARELCEQGYNEVTQMLYKKREAHT